MKTTKRSILRVLVGFTYRSTLLHVITYLVVGGLSYHFVAHRYWEGPQALPGLQNPHSAHVMRWFVPAQIIRGILHGFVLFPLRRALLDMKRWGGLVIGSILFMFGSVIGIGGAIEGWVYTTNFHLPLFLAHLPEVVIQTLLYGYLLLAWERRVERKYDVEQMPPNKSLEPTATAP
jgi:hypothetical protein